MLDRDRSSLSSFYFIDCDLVLGGKGNRRWTREQLVVVMVEGGRGRREGGFVHLSALMTPNP